VSFVSVLFQLSGQNKKRIAIAKKVDRTVYDV